MLNEPELELLYRGALIKLGPLRSMSDGIVGGGSIHLAESL